MGGLVGGDGWPFGWVLLEPVVCPASYEVIPSRTELVEGTAQVTDGFTLLPDMGFQPFDAASKLLACVTFIPELPAKAFVVLAEIISDTQSHQLGFFRYDQVRVALPNGCFFA